MKIRFSHFIAVTLVTVLGIAVSGCKEDTIIRAGITPSSDFIYTDNVIGDTLSILTKTFFDDSINTSYTESAIRPVHGLGVLNDPYFGKTNMGIYFQVVPPASALTLPTVDSAVLILPYAGFAWGDTNSTEQTYSVYEIKDDLKVDSVYYTKTYTNVDPNPISAAPVKISLKKIQDSVWVQNGKKAPHLRIKLTGYYKDALVNAAKNAYDNGAFLAAIKGLYIAANNPSNTDDKRIPYFFITGSSDYSRASVALYYQENGNTHPDSVRSTFLNFVQGTTVHYNYVTRDYTGKPANAFFQSTATSDTVIALQNEPGAAFDIKIPYLKNLPVGLINKAQLIITQVKLDNDANDLFIPPARIYPIGIDSLNKLYNILDRLPISNATLDFIDGVARDVAMPDGKTVKQYTLNIPREVQYAIVNKKELHLRINGTATYPAAYRLIAAGKQANKYYKIRLNIVYSKIN